MDGLDKQITDLGELPSKKEFVSLQRRVDDLENARKAQHKADTDTGKKLKQLKMRLDNLADLESRLGQIDAIIDEVRNFRNELDQMKDTQKKRNAMLDQGISQKANIADLDVLQNQIDGMSAK